MAVVITGTSITAPDGAIDAADLTGTLPALNGSAITDLDAANLTGVLPAIDGSALTGVGGSTTLGDVGTYGFLTHNNYYSNQDAGDTLAAAAADGLYWSNNDQAMDTTISISGTWQCMGRTDVGAARTTLWLRIA